jgi:hypothetical protein
MPATSGAFRASVDGRAAIGPSRANDRAAPTGRWRVDHPVRVFAAGCALIAIFGTGLMLSGYVPFASFRSAMEAGLWHNEEFGRTRVGEVLFATELGNACRKVEFHNTTGRFGPDITVRCDTGQPDDRTASVKRDAREHGRLLSVRDAFRR